MAVGTYIRQKVLPDGMSVSEAARRLGVSRPTLSTLLNGRSRLTRSMAGKLRDAFGADAELLLEKQNDRDRMARGKDESARPASHVPAFLEIRANDIVRWADEELSARTRLPVLLRRLVHSTGRDLTLVDFPGNDDGERRGCDGRVDADGATPWVPKGASYWEFGVSAGSCRKADEDYAARLKTVPERERRDGTFVFVSPRRWKTATTWAQEKRRRGDWQDVRAYDASTLEQWLETSASAQTWLAQELGLPTEGTETLESVWTSWSGACEPPLSPLLFEPAIRDHLDGEDGLRRWITAPPQGPLVVSADSRGEALAFVRCLFERLDDGFSPETLGAVDRTVVIRDPETARVLARTGAPPMIVAATRVVEEELTQLHSKVHCVFIRPRDPVDVKPGVRLGLLSHEAFRDATTAMGLPDEKADRLATETGRSPTVLRRRLARPGIAAPAWSVEAEHARSLVPLVLAGAWHQSSRADREALESLAGGTGGYERIERGLATLAGLDETPVWRAGGYAGVTSKVDVLFAIRDHVIKTDLERFLALARVVLGEEDPALELESGQRWAASFHGKVREHSEALRKSVGETLAVLAEHADHLSFRERLGIDVVTEIEELVSSLLDPLSETTLFSQASDLPLYAEAAPERFLQILERDLRSEHPIVHRLMQTTSDVLLGGCPRTGLLWALELCAWRHLHRVALLLAALSTIEITDRWSNTPFSSLKSLFRSWMPQTAAPLDDRRRMLRALIERQPDVGLKLCLELVDGRPDRASPNYRPRYRADASGFGGMATDAELKELERAALELALSHDAHDENTLGHLVRLIDQFPDEYRTKVWDLVDTWVAGAPSDEQRTALRETIRRVDLSTNACEEDRAREVFESLASEDPVVDHAWLFADRWIPHLAMELNDRGFDHDESEDEIARMRRMALEEISAAKGLDGVIELIRHSGAPYLVGQIAHDSGRVEDSIGLLSALLNEEGDHERSFDAAAEGYLVECTGPRREELTKALLDSSAEARAIRLFRVLPFEGRTWNLLDARDRLFQDRYWSTVTAIGWFDDDEDASRAVGRLLSVGRPHAAFRCARRNPEIETAQLVRTLAEMSRTEPATESDHLPDGYGIARLFESLSTRPDATLDELARLEFVYLSELLDTAYGVPNFETVVCRDPLLLVQMLALLYRRDDDGADPEGWWPEDERTRTDLAGPVWRFLRKTSLLPGKRSDGHIDRDSLWRWVEEVRDLSRKYGRAVPCDQTIGQILSRAKRVDDGNWPPDVVCETMERTASSEMGEGFRLGILNGRDVKVGEGGDVERDFATRYEDDAERLRYSYPFVCNVLEELASYLRGEAEHEDLRAATRRRLG